MEDLFSIIPLHDDLDRKVLAGDSRMFLSDWNGSHPLASVYLGELATKPYSEWGSMTKYSEMQYDDELRGKIARFHNQSGESAYGERNIYPAAGSASFLATVAMWIAETFVGQPVYYLPPLYYNLAWWLRRLRCDVRAAMPAPALGAISDLDLPRRQSVLLVTDPLWFAGRRLPEGVILAIRDWQSSTDSVVFVDGTFQYLGWNGQRAERTSTLVPEATLRLVCPTKSLAMHGCRFAYLIAPDHLVDEVGELHGNLHGPAPLSDRIFAHRAMDVLISPTSNRQLLGFVRSNYHRLIDSGAVTEYVPPESGYFLFGRPAVTADAYLGMDQNFYQLSGYAGYCRINLCKSEAVEFLLSRSRDVPDRESAKT